MQKCVQCYNQPVGQLTLKKGREGERKEGRKEKGKRKRKEKAKKQNKTHKEKKKPWLKLNLQTSVVSLLPLWWTQVTTMMSLNVNWGRDMTTGYTIMCIIVSSVADSLVCILVILCNNCSEYRSYFNIALCFLAQLYIVYFPPQFGVHKNMWPCVICFRRKSEIGDSPWKCLLDSLLTRTCAKGSFSYHLGIFVAFVRHSRNQKSSSSVQKVDPAGQTCVHGGTRHKRSCPRRC